MNNNDPTTLLLPYSTGGCLARLGIEVGSLSSFFSSERAEKQGITYRTFTIDGVTHWEYATETAMPESELLICERGESSITDGRRELTVEALKESLLMDAVLRFVVPLELVDEVAIGEEVIAHRAKNRYHQRPMQPVSLKFKSGADLRFAPIFSVVPEGMNPVVYFRDELRQWILHFRILAMQPDATVFKGCHRWFNTPFPEWLQVPVRKCSWLQQQLLYVRERVSQRIPVQVNGAVRLKKNERVQFGVTWEWR